jgi:putative membrane protein
MAVASRVKTGIRARPLAITAVLTAVGYALVIGTFAGVVDFYPELSPAQVDFLTHLIAVVNAAALSALVAGVYFITRRDYRKHQVAMVTAFVLILLFLVVYLVRVGGGFEKRIIAPDAVRLVYLVMLAIHILLSIVSVPVVLYAVLLGSTHTPGELAGTRKATVGRIAASAWILSLALGIVTYVLLNHVYASEPREAALLLALAVPWSLRELRAGRT